MSSQGGDPRTIVVVRQFRRVSPWLRSTRPSSSPLTPVHGPCQPYTAIAASNVPPTIGTGIPAVGRARCDPRRQAECHMVLGTRSDERGKVVSPTGVDRVAGGASV